MFRRLQLNRLGLRRAAGTKKPRPFPSADLLQAARNRSNRLRWRLSLVSAVSARRCLLSHRLMRSARFCNFAAVRSSTVSAGLVRRSARLSFLPATRTRHVLDHAAFDEGVRAAAVRRRQQAERASEPGKPSTAASYNYLTDVFRRPAAILRCYTPHAPRARRLAVLAHGGEFSGA
jgi:hypothetical protein